MNMKAEGLTLFKKSLQDGLARWKREIERAVLWPEA